MTVPMSGAMMSFEKTLLMAILVVAALEASVLLYRRVKTKRWGPTALAAPENG